MNPPAAHDLMKTAAHFLLANCRAQGTKVDFLDFGLDPEWTRMKEFHPEATVGGTVVIFLPTPDDQNVDIFMVRLPASQLKPFIDLHWPEREKIV